MSSNSTQSAHQFLRTPLHVAIKHRDFRMAELLIESNSFVDALDFLGNSVLHYALDSDSTDLVFVS